MLELPKNASREMVEALNKRFGDSMVVAHRSDTNSVFLTGFGGHNGMPSCADFEALVPGSRVRYGHAECVLRGESPRRERVSHPPVSRLASVAESRERRTRQAKRRLRPT